MKIIFYLFKDKVEKCWFCKKREAVHFGLCNKCALDGTN